MIVRTPLLLIYLLFVMAAHAGQPCASDDCEPQKALIIRELKEAYQRLNQAISKCDEIQENRVIERGVIPTERLTRSQALLVIGYKAEKAKEECSAKARKNLAMAVNRVEVFGYGDQLHSQNKEIYQNSKTAVRGMKSFYELKLDYIQSIPASYRDKIDDIEALKRPFDPVRTAKRYSLTGPPEQ